MASLVKCKSCEHEIAKSAKSCPNCGAKNKKSRWVLKTFGVLVVLLILIGIFGGQGSNSSLEGTPKPSESAYAEGKELDYREAALGEVSTGDLLVLRGEVLQLIGNESARLATKSHGSFGYSGDDVYLVFDVKPRVVEEDVVEIKGRYDGVVTYETVLGAERSIPRIFVDYYSVIEPRG